MLSHDNSDLPEVPANFMPYAEEIRATAKDTVSFRLTPATNMTLWQSKVGGEPYLPLTEQYPLNGKGKALMFLLQINFSEMPHLPDYPEKGILEFYVDGHDKSYLIGKNYQDLTKQEGFRVLYFENVVEDPAILQHDTGKYQKDPRPIHFPLRGGIAYSIEYRLEKQFITWSDYRFDLSFKEDHNLVDQYGDETVGSQLGRHRVGGYPTFPQQDPREFGGKFEGYELLVQLDSDSDYKGCVFKKHIMWGDAGVGAFFIKPSDLKERDFSKVMYNWHGS